MEELSLSLWDILFLPISLPLRSAMISLSYLQHEVEKASDTEGSTWEALLELEVLREIGQIADEEYAERRARLEAQLSTPDMSSWEDGVRVDG